jgi:Caspase domain
VKVWAAIVVVLLLLLPSVAHAAARFALLIGNRFYDRSVGVLKNPYNDIAVVGEALAKQDFQVLPPIKDAKRTAILGGVRELVSRLNTAGAGAIGFIYYSGHGAAEKDTNINYLIPVDAKEPGTTAFWDESVKLDDLLRLRHEEESRCRGTRQGRSGAATPCHAAGAGSRSRQEASSGQVRSPDRLRS